MSLLAPIRSQPVVASAGATRHNAPLSVAGLKEALLDVYLISRIPGEAVDHFIPNLEALGSSFLGPQFKTEVRAVAGSGSWRTVVTTARNGHNPLPELYFEDDSLIYLFSGYLVDVLSEGRSPRSYFSSPTRDHRPIKRSPGGIYSYATVRIRDGQVCAGHSLPTMEPNYYESSPDHLHVGNHPLLVHMAARGFSSPVLNELFLFSSLSAGVAIDDSTPFVGCRRISPESNLVGNATSCSFTIRPASSPASRHDNISTSSRRVESVAGALIEAGSVLKRMPRAEFRVSGGKDSRLVAAYLKHADIDVVPINQNFPEEVEGQVADMVAAALGHSCVRQPIEEVLDRGDIEGGTRRKIAYGGGLPAIASLQYPTRSEGSVPGVPLIMGHAHLQRGGFLQRIRTVNAAYEVTESRTVSKFLRPAYVDQNLQQVRRFVDETLLKTNNVVQRIAFHAYLQYAMNYQFQSLYAYVRNWNSLVTPLLDERFVSLCREIADAPVSKWRRGYAGITDLHGERIAMGVTEKLAPELLTFPLSADRYRADVPDLPGHSSRDPDLIEPRQIAVEDMQRVFDTRRIGPDIRGQIWERIESTVVSQFGREAVRPEIWAYVSNPSSRMPAGETLTLLNQFVWGLYGQAIIFGSEWWKDLAKA